MKYLKFFAALILPPQLHFWGAAASGAMSIAGSMMGNKAAGKNASAARQFQREEALKNRLFQAGQSRIARQYNTEMSGSVHQRQVRDLVRAGLNPILSANSGASSPQSPVAAGSQASAGAAPFDPEQQSLGNLGSSALMKNLNKTSELKQAKSTTKILKTQEKTAHNTNLLTAGNAKKALHDADSAEYSAKGNKMYLQKLEKHPSLQWLDAINRSGASQTANTIGRLTPQGRAVSRSNSKVKPKM